MVGALKLLMFGGFRQMSVGALARSLKLPFSSGPGAELAGRRFEVWRFIFYNVFEDCYEGV